MAASASDQQNGSDEQDEQAADQSQSDSQAESQSEDQPTDESAEEPDTEQPPVPLEGPLGDRIRALRQRQKLSLSELSRLSGVSKGYLSQVERSIANRPSAATVFSVADALGVPVAELYEGAEPAETMLDDAEIPDSLRQFVEEASLPPVDVEMLAAIRYRGAQPRTREDWRFLYESIRRSVIQSRQ